jgi:hypothetical protein
VSEAFHIGKAAVAAHFEAGSREDEKSLLLLPQETQRSSQRDEVPGSRSTAGNTRGENEGCADVRLHDVSIFGDLEHGKLQDLTPPLPHTNVPPTPLFLVGRHAEIHRVVAHLASPHVSRAAQRAQVVVVAGGRGVGKRTVVACAARYLWERGVFGGGVVSVGLRADDLASARSRSGVSSRMSAHGTRKQPMDTKARLQHDRHANQQQPTPSHPTGTGSCPSDPEQAKSQTGNSGGSTLRDLIAQCIADALEKTGVKVGAGEGGAAERLFAGLEEHQKSCGERKGVGDGDVLLVLHGLDRTRR